jgi:MOSC domain-containing protein YiiM
MTMSESKPMESCEERDERIDRNVVKRISYGRTGMTNRLLAEGKFLTEADLERQRQKVLAYRFK